MKLKDKNVVITGGASGIGKIMSRIAHEKGAKNVVVWDLSVEDGDHQYHLDVTDLEAVKDVYARTKAAIGEVDILIQCAGIVRGNKPFSEQTEKDIRLTMEVNSIAPMQIGLLVLPDMLKRDSGCLCTVASAAGMLAMPKLSVYTASKWAAIGWSESMRIELQRQHSHVQVSTIAPYFINTGMFDGIHSKIFPILDPEKTAKKIIRAVERGKHFAGIPFPYHFIRLMQGIFPECIFDWLFGDVFGLYTVMDHFTGRKNNS